MHFGSPQSFICVCGFRQARGVFMISILMFYFPCLFCVLVSFSRSHDGPMCFRVPWTSCGYSAVFLSLSSDFFAWRFPHLTSSCGPLCILIKSHLPFYDLVSNLFRSGRPTVHALGSLSPVAQTALRGHLAVWQVPFRLAFCKELPDSVCLLPWRGRADLLNSNVTWQPLRLNVMFWYYFCYNIIFLSKCCRSVSFWMSAMVKDFLWCPKW